MILPKEHGHDIVTKITNIFTFAKNKINTDLVQFDLMTIISQAQHAIQSSKLYFINEV